MNEAAIDRETNVFTRFRPRPLAFLGIEPASGFRLKMYSIRYDDSPFDRSHFRAGWELALASLPQPAVGDGRPGVGFAILHRGRTGDYLILSWWDRENELPTRVFLREAEVWRPASGGESFCVWDLRVLGWEREAYVGTVLAGRADGVEAYLKMVVEGFA
jgi:hypothetical protein